MAILTARFIHKGDIQVVYGNIGFSNSAVLVMGKSKKTIDWRDGLRVCGLVFSCYFLDLQFFANTIIEVQLRPKYTNWIYYLPFREIDKWVTHFIRMSIILPLTGFVFHHPLYFGGSRTKFPNTIYNFTRIFKITQYLRFILQLINVWKGFFYPNSLIH